MTWPRVTLHYAQTLDGRIATRSGHSRWISCPETLELAHRLRAEHDAVLVGVGTILADDPQLTVRLVPGRSPLRVVADSALRTPLDAHVLADGAAPTLLATTVRGTGDRLHALQSMNVEVLTLAADEMGRVSLPALLDSLAERGLTSLLVEGGSRLITSLLRRRLVDRLVVTVAPKIAGAGIEAVGDLGIVSMDDAIRLCQVHLQHMGTDLVIEGVPGYA